jgi:hypothetical protein
VWAVVLLAFLMSFSIGANDAANALATSYGSNAARLIVLLLLGALFEFLGAFYCSHHVAGNLVESIIGDINELPQKTQEQMMLGASIASFIFIMSSSLFGMPISGTHTVVGALIGAGIVGAGSDQIDWGSLGRIVASWVISPVLTGLISFCLFMIVCLLTLGGIGATETVLDFESANDSPASKKLSINARLLWLTFIGGLSSSLICFMALNLVSKDDTPMDSFQKYTLLPLTFIFGAIACRLIILMTALSCLRSQPGNSTANLTAGQTLKGLFVFWTAKYASEILQGTCGVVFSDQKQIDTEQPRLEENPSYGVQHR